MATLKSKPWPWLSGTLVLLLACNLGRSAPTVTDAQQTLAAQQLTIQALQATLAMAGQNPTAQASPAGATPASTPAPFPTTPAPAITPTLTASPTAFPTPAPPRLTVSVDTNCREGPGEVYERVGYLRVGEEAEVLGRSTAGDYWYVRLPDGATCWLWGQYATVTGDTGSVPQMTPPPTPGLAVITGVVFHDTNGNGRQDSGEGPFADLRVELSAATGGRCSAPLLKVVYTDAQGRYTIEVEPATYCVSLPGGPPWCTYGDSTMIWGMGGSAVVQVRPGRTTTLNFGALGCSPYDPSCRCP